MRAREQHWIGFNRKCQEVCCPSAGLNGHYRLNKSQRAANLLAAAMAAYRLLMMAGTMGARLTDNSIGTARHPKKEENKGEVTANALHKTAGLDWG